VRWRIHVLFTLVGLCTATRAQAALRHRVPAFEPTDLDLEDPLTLELDMQFGVLKRDGEPNLRVFVPDFELDFGLTSRVELDVDGALSLDRQSGHFTFAGDNLWVSTKLGFYADQDPLDPDRAWALGAQLGPRLPTAPHSAGTGFGAVLLGARMAPPWHFIVNLGAVLEPIDRSERLRSFALVSGLDLDYDLDVENRWSVLAELGAGYSSTSSFVGEFSYTFGDLGVVLHAQGQQHSLAAAECVDEHRHRMTANVFEQKRGSALFGNTIRDLRNLELGIHFRADSFELISLFENRNELSQVFNSHRFAVRFLKAERSTRGGLRQINRRLRGSASQ